MKRNRAYVLLTVLLLLTLAAVVLAGVCRLAVGQSLDATAASDELQRKWGTLGCRDTLLPRAENVIELEETPANPVRRVHADFNLGTEQFSVDIGDEQSKANVNEIFALQGKARAEQTVRQLVASTGGLKPRFRLITGTKLPAKSAAAVAPQPSDPDSRPPDPSGRMLRLFGSWSEVFDGVGFDDLHPGNPGAVTCDLTCWGDGRLNVLRASAPAVTAVCGPTLSPDQISRLLVLRARLGDNATVDQLLAGAHVGTGDALNLAGRLTVTSATHCLWVVTRDHSGVGRSLFVQDASNPGDVRSFAFQW
jgi:type II secretory pathway component PulK